MANSIDYWLHWQVPICALIILIPTIVAVWLISRVKRVPLYASDLWMPCWKGLHPIWLLGYRAIVFVFMSWLLYHTAAVHGSVVFLFYTQWTFALVIVYFAIGTAISAHGCWKYSKIHGNDTGKKDVFLETAGFWGYLMQIIYQVSAGASMLTDIVFWCLLLPTSKGQFTMTLLIGCIHAFNLVFLLIDTVLNKLPFPWFRMTYFVFWSASYITFQWVLHVCCISWWPYLFLELSTPWAPAWYFALALVHIPCYWFYVLIVKWKNSIFRKLFPRAFVVTH